MPQVILRLFSSCTELTCMHCLENPFWIAAWLLFNSKCKTFSPRKSIAGISFRGGIGTCLSIIRNCPLEDTTIQRLSCLFSFSPLCLIRPALASADGKELKNAIPRFLIWPWLVLGFKQRFQAKTATTAADKKDREKKFLQAMVKVEKISHLEQQTLSLEKQLETEWDGNRRRREWAHEGG